MKHTNRKLVRDYGATIVAAVIVALLIRFFVIEAYRIPSSSMHPALDAGDTIFVAKEPLGYSKTAIPTRGDILVYTDPGELHRDYIKRVVGLPGETLQVSNGKVSINGNFLRMDTISNSKSCSLEFFPEGASHEVCWEPPMLDDFGPKKVPDDSVFVIGDTRSKSLADQPEHKTWGIIPISAVKGKALAIWLSVDPRTTGFFPQFRFERMFKRIQ